MKKKITGLLLIAAILISGCNTKPSETVQSLSSEQAMVTSSSETEITATETEKQLFEYNPHPYVSFLSSDIPQDYWESFNNLSDALRRGESTFKCSSEEAYKWCTYWGTLYILMPAASLMIEGESNDGSTPFENGTGRIYYQMPAEDFVKRQAEFEKTVIDILYYRNKVGIEETKEVLKNYLAKPDRNLIQLRRYADALGCGKILGTYLEVLL